MLEHNNCNKYTSQQVRNERDVVDFGKRVREIREARGITLDKLSDMTEIDKAALSRIENGVRIPKYDTFLCIIDALGAPLADFMPSRFFHDDVTWSRIRALYMRMSDKEKSVAGRYILAMLIGLQSIEE